METYFNIDKYIEFQEKLHSEYKSDKITAKEYHEKSSYTKETEEIQVKVIELRKWITENNLPFSVEYTNFNIQTLLEINFKLIDGYVKHRLL